MYVVKIHVQHEYYQYQVSEMDQAISHGEAIMIIHDDSVELIPPEDL